METPGPDDEDETTSHNSEELQEELHGTAEHVPEGNQHEDLQDALQPHVPEEDAGQEVFGHQEGVPPPRLPRIQEMPQ